MNLFSVKNILFFLGLIPIAVIANSNMSPSSNSQYSIGLDLGIAKPTNIGNNTTFQSGYSTFSYGSNTNNTSDFVSGISISKLLTITPLDALQVGVSAHYISNMNLDGDLEQGISPPYYQATYSYSINSYQYLVDTKLRHQFRERYFPYIYLGLGVASNRAYGYSTTVPDYLTLTPEYSSHTTYSFSYSVGIGMDYFVMPNLSVGLGYRFINLGRVGLGQGVIRDTNVGAKLTQSNLYMNTLLAQLNYFI